MTDVNIDEALKPLQKMITTLEGSAAARVKYGNELGAKIQEVEVGEINVVDAMQEKKSVVGGEGSSGGSIISPQTSRDGMLSTLTIAQHLTRANKTLEQVINALPKYYTKNENVKITPKQGLRTLLENHFNKHKNELTISKTGDEYGGLKIRFDDNAWLWFRPSRTEPALVRVFAESKDEERAQAILKKGVKLLKSL